MRFALIQMNPTIGDLDANAERLIDFAVRAREQGVSIAIAPERCVTGYPPKDLLDRPAFVRRASEVTNRIVDQIPDGLTLIFGTLGTPDDSVTDAQTTDARARLSNDAVIAQRGRVQQRISKCLLPSYDVFDETRYFVPAAPPGTIDIDGSRICVTICEDLWGQSDALRGRYKIDPLTKLAADTELIVNLSASPFTMQKFEQRSELFSQIALQCSVPIAMVNQVGANDELLFDGRSGVWTANGERHSTANSFEEQLLICDLSAPPSTPRAVETDIDEEVYQGLVCGVRDYARKCGFTRVVLGLSGGIDSALTATIAADALGPDRVLGVAMPTRYSSAGSVHDARALSENLGLQFRIVDIDPMFQSYLDSLKSTLDELQAATENDTTLENIQARIRGATVMAISNRTGALVLTTGNKSELAVGYCTLYGDMVGGLAVISDIPKTQVYRLSRLVNRQRIRIPVSSIEKPPSAALRLDQVDQDSLPAYEVLDALLELLVEERLGVDEILARGFDADVVERIVHLIRINEYKRRQAAPGLIVSHKAFGPGRRMPIAHRYTEKVPR